MLTIFPFKHFNNAVECRLPRQMCNKEDFLKYLRNNKEREIRTISITSIVVLWLEFLLLFRLFREPTISSIRVVSLVQIHPLFDTLHSSPDQDCQGGIFSLD